MRRCVWTEVRQRIYFSMVSAVFNLGAIREGETCFATTDFGWCKNECRIKRYRYDVETILRIPQDAACRAGAVFWILVGAAHLRAVF